MRSVILIARRQRAIGVVSEFKSFNNSTRELGEQNLLELFFENLGKCSKGNYSYQVWTERRRWQCYRMLWNNTAK